MSTLVGQIAFVISCVLYAAYLYTGLLLLLLPILDLQCSNFLRSTIYALPWTCSVSCLAAANNFHAFFLFGPLESTTFLLWSIVVCISLEEFGLRTGKLFGSYWFTSALGPRITEHQPLMVPILWQCFCVPVFLLARCVTKKLTFDNGFQMILFEALIGALIMVGFDLVSEPVAVSKGHALWEHMAWVDSDFKSYNSAPDWVFQEPMHTSPTSFLNSIRYFENIPLHNFVGWFTMGFIIYAGHNILMTLFCQKSKVTSRAPVTGIVYRFLPAIVSIYCTQAFYVIHPGHEMYTRVTAVVYLSLLTLLLLLPKLDKKTMPSKLM